MNIQEYISSGVLEAYALGDLSAVERVEVEKNLIQYVELREELSKIEDMQETLLMSLAVMPPSSVKAKVMQAVQPQGKAVAMDTSLIRWKYAAAASVILALGLGYLAYDYRDKWIHSQVALNELITQSQQVAQDYNRVNLRLDKMENDLKVINDPSFTKVVMKGTPNAPQSLASVYWNDRTREVYLSIQNMRELSQENQYQLWAIIDGKPVDAGVFDGNVTGLVRMKDITSGAVTFAVTIEPRGGKSSPTLQTMQVAGNVSKS
ncbi:MAG: anti-sigma factor [Bacteroidetes bacterium]|nr:anti-sigma factor [Bacteroidota bacterium]MBI3482849.1 anti-sigma factor [Bacteroidota bacterium]